MLIDRSEEMEIVFSEHLHSALSQIDHPHNFLKYFPILKTFHSIAAILKLFLKILSHFIVMQSYDQYFILLGQNNMKFTTNKMEGTLEGLYLKCLTRTTILISLLFFTFDPYASMPLIKKRSNISNF